MNSTWAKRSQRSAFIFLTVLAVLYWKQTFAQEIDFGIAKKAVDPSFLWQQETNSFRMYDGKDYSFEDIVEMLQVEKGGEVFFQEKLYPWIKMGNSPWVFGPAGELRYCPACAGTGNPEDPPWDPDPDPKPSWPVEGPFIVQTGPIQDGTYVARHDSTISWSCRRLYFAGAVESKWMECRK